jgi:uncharacterized phage protein (predicted DNA packaging)
MPLEDIKLYLRVDGDEDDNLITLMMQAAQDYISAAVGNFNAEDSRTQILQAAMVQELYDHRELCESEQQMKWRISQMFQSTMLQLDLENLPEAGDQE